MLLIRDLHEVAIPIRRVEIDSAVHHAHTWSCGYANFVAGASWGALITTMQYRKEAYHGEGAQVR